MMLGTIMLAAALPEKPPRGQPVTVRFPTWMAECDMTVGNNPPSKVRYGWLEDGQSVMEGGDGLHWPEGRFVFKLVDIPIVSNNLELVKMSAIEPADKIQGPTGYEIFKYEWKTGRAKQEIHATMKGGKFSGSRGDIVCVMDNFDLRVIEEGVQ
jgi:hypothetical protein